MDFIPEINLLEKFSYHRLKCSFFFYSGLVLEFVSRVVYLEKAGRWFPTYNIPLWFFPFIPVHDPSLFKKIIYLFSRSFRGPFHLVVVVL